jgi:hypothetical protein
MRLVPIGVLALTLAAAVPAALQDSGEEHHEESVLHENMELIEETLGRLRRELRDASNHRAALERVVVVQQAVLACKNETPPMAASLPEGERQAFVDAFRGQMITLMRGLLELEEALLADDNEAAQAALRKVREMEDPGHERFTEDDD